MKMWKESEIEKTLDSLDGLERAKAPEGLSDDILQKVSFLTPSNKWSKWIKYGIAAMIIMTLGNTYFVLDGFDEDYERSNYIELVVEDLIDSNDYFFESYEE